MIALLLLACLSPAADCPAGGEVRVLSTGHVVCASAAEACAFEAEATHLACRGAPFHEDVGQALAGSCARAYKAVVQGCLP